MASTTLHDPSMLLTGNYYKVLGLSPGATKEDIDKAYKQQARHFHPDKNPNPKAEEWMKQINQAKEVLSDQIRRAKYDDELQNDDADSQALFESAGALLPGRQLSVKLMELFAVWLKEEKMIKHSQFQQSLKEFLDIFLKEKFKQWVEQQQPLYKKPIPKKPSKECLYSLCLDATNKVAKEISLLATDQVREIVSSVLQLSRTTSYKQYPSVIQPGTVVPLIDLSQADLSQLGTFFQLFFGDSDNKLSKKEMLATLMEFVPHVTVCAPMTKPGRSNCAMCNQRLPKKLLVYSTILPRLGQMRPQKICTSCHKLTYHHDMNAWIEAGVGYLRTGGLSKIRPALGCFTLASSYCPHNIEPALKLTRTFLEIGVPEFGLPLLSDILKNHKEPIASMKAHLLASSSLKSMADWPNENLFEQWQLLFAAKEACVLALSASCSVDNLTDAPELSTRKSELDAAVYSHLEKIEDNYKSLVQTTLNALELAWSKRDWGQILNVLKEDTCEDDYNLAVLNNKRHHKIEALHQFVISKEGFLSKLLPDDRFPVLFLRAVLSVQKGQLSSGLKDLEAAAWNNHHTRWLLKEVIGIVLALLPNYTGSIMPFKALHITCNSLARGSGIHSSSPLFPTPDELFEPQKLHWEELTVPNLGMKGTRRFEQSVSRQVNAGKLTVRGAALAYIDYCLACQHPAECAICFLTASIWFLRELKQKATQAPKKYPELYALKNAVRWSLKHAGIITSLALHPGMRVYISRLGVVAMLHAVELAGHFSTPEDSKLVVHFLEMFTYNCRFCPFWHAPIVSVSEAVLLHIFTGQLHNEFILGLDDVSLISVPLSKSELRYQLYENELRHLNPSQNPAEVHRNAMCALLQEKKWSFDDVVHLMTSPLSPRTPDGWLIQQPTLGRSLEYTKFAGFVVDPNAASIQLLVVPARLSPRRVGLFSRSDINTVLQLGKDDLLPVFFSLDPPNENQQFHPFQQIRYFPESLYETDLLHTLFETDYLLKSFSVGCEVSSVPPFSQRPCSKGLTASLPSKLRDILKPISARGDRSSHINRFWIQAEKLVYSTVQVDSQVKFLFSDPVMAIHTHPQLPGQDGLQDTEDDPDPHSPEAKFAADLTSNYRKISEHFPMFARLQELVKLQFFGVVLNNIIENVKEMVNSTDIDVPDELLQAIHADQRSSKMETINEMLSNIYDQVKWHYNLSTSSEIQSQIVDALMETTSYNLSRWTLSDYVANWLYTKNEYTQSQLASYICSSVPLVTRNEVKNMLLEQRRKTFQPFLSLVQSLQLAARRGAPKKRANGCNWVPAALNKMDDEDTVSLCYGGVLIAPKVVQGSVPLVQNVSRVSLTPSAASQAGSSGTGQSGGGNGSGGGGGHGGSGGRGGGGHSGGGRRLNLNDPCHQWSHVFHTKPGHVEPKYNSSQERFKKLFAHVAYYGTESKDPRVALNQKHGDNVKEMQYRKGTVWVRYTKEGVVKSAGVNR